jgi:hypothetical protein
MIVVSSAGFGLLEVAAALAPRPSARRAGIGPPAGPDVTENQPLSHVWPPPAGQMLSRIV